MRPAPTSYDFHTAPMHRHTSLDKLRVFRWISQEAILHHEMVTLPSFLKSPQRWDCDIPGVVFQIASDGEGRLREAAHLALQLGYQELNWNLGCPSSSLQALGAGACLYRRVDAVLKGLEYLTACPHLKISIKCRVGVDEKDQLDDFIEFIRICSEVGGCQRFYVHARKAWLSGVNPRKNRSVPPLQPDWVKICKALWPELYIVFNGGLRDWETIHQRAEGLDGVMVGRKLLHQPMMLTCWDQLKTPSHGGFDAEVFWQKLEGMLTQRMEKGSTKTQLFQKFATLFSGTTWHVSWTAQWHAWMQNQGGSLRLKRPQVAFELKNTSIPK